MSQLEAELTRCIHNISIYLQEAGGIMSQLEAELTEMYL